MPRIKEFLYINNNYQLSKSSFLYVLNILPYNKEYS